MDDLISRKSAIDVLCDNCDHVEAVCPHYPCKQYLGIKNLPSAQPENTWNPTNKTLPNKPGVYLVTTNKGNVYLWSYKPETEKFWLKFVTGWCYLPKPNEE